MKFLTPTLFLLSVSIGLSAPAITLPTAAPVSDAALLSAIAQVETGNHSDRLGSRGERTRLQILPQTWRRYSTQPHANHTRTETDRVAHLYLAHIRSRLRARGLPETPFFIAAAWNAGPEWHRLSRGTVAYAERVANLVNEKRGQEVTGRMIVATASTKPLVLFGSDVPAEGNRPLVPPPVIRLASAD